MTMECSFVQYFTFFEVIFDFLQQTNIRIMFLANCKLQVIFGLWNVQFCPLDWILVTNWTSVDVDQIFDTCSAIYGASRLRVSSRELDSKSRSRIMLISQNRRWISIWKFMWGYLRPIGTFVHHHAIPNFIRCIIAKLSLIRHKRPKKSPFSWAGLWLVWAVDIASHRLFTIWKYNLFKNDRRNECSIRPGQIFRCDVTLSHFSLVGQ